MILIFNILLVLVRCRLLLILVFVSILIFMPSLEDLGKAGESASETLSRIGSEFNVLVDAATNLGHSLADSTAFIKNASFESRSSFVDAAGGISSLAEKTAFFANNFLTDSERLQPAMDSLSIRMKDLGIAADISKDQFKDLVRNTPNFFS